MKSNNNQKQQISWCLSQKKGLKLETPNNDLCKAYILKAKSALNMLNAAIERNEIDWIVTTAYYARYFTIYALLQKCGIKSEIHDCTISAFHYLFVEDGVIDQNLYDEICLAKELRTDTQYYVTDELDQEKLKKDSETARSFVLKMEEIIEKTNPEQIERARKKLRQNKC